MAKYAGDMKLKFSIRLIATALIIASVGIAPISANAATDLVAAKNDVAAFWTADRIKRAIPFDMVFEPGASVAKRVPAAKPSGGTGGSVKGASWNNGGLPLTASGKVFFAVGANYYQCSGALVKDGKNDRSIVLTAGHCVYDNASQAYVTNWIFIPSYDVNRVSISGCSTSNGCWPAVQVYAHSGFTSQTGFTTQATLYDWGFAKITAKKNGVLPDGGSTSDGSNSFPIEFSSLPLSSSVSSFGYPAAGKYKGTDLVYSSGPISFDSGTSNQTYSLVSDMTGGCSGGPWLSSMSTTSPYSGTLSSVNSYKYGTTAFIYGPKFNSDTQATYLQARN